MARTTPKLAFPLQPFAPYQREEVWSLAFGHSNESFGETLQSRSARNEADKLRRARKRSDQFSQRKPNRVHSQIEVNVPEYTCGNTSEVCEFYGALYWKNEVNSNKKYTKCCHDGKIRLPNLIEAPDLFKELLYSK
ncbi:hypothetical protein AVEN_113497-1 [Araneus ventricosus]|uniref:Uncharacterized protein n=1 Tax=Araneus ventricosus TaxID=182803 RepID=A0A4Y2GE04_ARAVE|nr:hypothetical protein AVEN_113497-1 [Araneus ventricosus]